MHTCSYFWIRLIELQLNKLETKNPLLAKGLLNLSCGEYEIWTHALVLSNDGLAIRCITALPTLQWAEDEGLEPPRALTRRFSKPLPYQLD